MIVSLLPFFGNSPPVASIPAILVYFPGSDLSLSCIGMKTELRYTFSEEMKKSRTLYERPNYILLLYALTILQSALTSLVPWSQGVHKGKC